jgi:peptidyl-prolyl cis-trans isomerase C
MKKKLLSLALVAAGSVAYSPVGMAQGPNQQYQGGTVTDPNKVLAVVNGQNITHADLVDFGGAMIENAPPPQRMALLHDLVTRKLVEQDALDKGLDKNPEFISELEKRKAKMLETLRTNTLFEFGIRNYLQANPVQDEQLQQAYQQYKPIQQYLLRHIVLKDYSEARQAITQIQKGADFGKLASEKSLDRMSGQWGGNLGWLPKEQMYPQIAAVVVGMKKGQLHPEPIQSKAGWHVLFLTDTRELKPIGYEQAKAQLAGEVQAYMTSEYMKKLREQAQVTIHEKFDVPGHMQVQ